MRKNSASDAKELLELIDAVDLGETRLVPIPFAETHFATPAEAADWLRSQRMKKGRLKLRELIDEGRS